MSTVVIEYLMNLKVYVTLFPRKIFFFIRNLSALLGVFMNNNLDGTGTWSFLSQATNAFSRKIFN